VLKKIGNRIEDLQTVRLLNDGHAKGRSGELDKVDSLARELKIRLRFEAGDKAEAEKTSASIR